MTEIKTDYAEPPARNTLEHVIKHVRCISEASHGISPIVRYHGTISVKGVEAAIVMTDTHMFTQAGGRVLSGSDDPHGFARFVGELPEDVLGMLYIPGHAAHGTWCGGDLSEDTALSNTDKMFMIHTLQRRNGDGTWTACDYIGVEQDHLQVMNAFGIHHIYQYPSYALDIDFDKGLAHIQEKLSDCTRTVVSGCPVGLCLGHRGAGIGVNWRPLDPEFTPDTDMWFSVTGNTLPEPEDAA